MLTQLSTLKSRLGMAELDTTSDALLEAINAAVSARFDRECNRTFERTMDFAQEFCANQTEILLACYPLETVTRFDLKFTESEGWLEKTDVEYLVRSRCVLSLSSPLNARPATLNPVGRVIYTGGYVPPGTVPGPGQTALPADLAQAAVEQTAWSFQNRDRLGLVRIWEYHSTYRQFADLDLLTPVKAVLKRYERWGIGQ
jgi:hypothetical protein